VFNLVALIRQFSFRPRLLGHLRHYTRADFSADLASGLTVGVVALPLSMAFGIASGVRPDQGIITAIIGGFLISALGGTRVQIGGPAGAFVALLYGIAEKYGVANLLLATMMAGVLLFTMGAFRLGNLVRYIPISIVIGFTAGIAIVIGISQVKDLLGLAIPKSPSNFFSQVSVIAQYIHTVNWVALGVGLSSIAIIVFWPATQSTQAAASNRWKRITAKLPSTIVVLVLWSLLVWFFQMPVDTIGTKFGELPRGLPLPAMPAFDWQTAQNLVAPTMAIALLCAVESLLCARVADGLIQDRHDPNQELMAQGIANFVVPFFGGIAATGTMARTMTNVRAGARSPVAGIVHALVLFLIILVAAPLATHIPLAALAAILLWVAYSMGDWKEFLRLRQFSVFYRTTLLTTFLLTVVFDLVVAVEVGLVLSSLFFIYRISALTTVQEISLDGEIAANKSVRAYRLFGSLFFGSVTKLEHLLDPRGALPDTIILELHQLINVDTTGLDALSDLLSRTQKRGGKLLLVAVNQQPLSLMTRAGFIKRIGSENIFATMDEALSVADDQ
jgi:sulfate permease, SulP family